MHLNQLGKANGPTSQTLDPGSQSQVWPFNLLGVLFARRVLICIEMTPICTILVHVIALDPKGLQQFFQLQKHLILTTSKDLC